MSSSPLKKKRRRWENGRRHLCGKGTPRHEGTKITKVSFVLQTLETLLSNKNLATNGKRANNARLALVAAPGGFVLQTRGTLFFWQGISDVQGMNR
jgi:hypothetical protein